MKPASYWRLAIALPPVTATVASIAALLYRAVFGYEPDVDSHPFAYYAYAAIFFGIVHYCVWASVFLAWTRSFDAERLLRAVCTAPILYAAFVALTILASRLLIPFEGVGRLIAQSVGIAIAIGYIFVLLAFALKHLGESVGLITRPAVRHHG